MESEARYSFPTDSAIEEFEEKNQLRLPLPYRAFIARYDGRLNGPLAVRSVDVPVGKARYVVATLLPLAEEAVAGFENLQTFVETYKDRGRAPSNTIAIAADPFGN